MLVPTHEESPGIGDTRDRTDVTSIRIPSATSTISASFMQYTVSVAGALVAAPTLWAQAAVCFLVAVFTDTTFLSSTGAVIQEGRTLVLVLDFRVSMACFSRTGPKLTLSCHTRLI